MRRTAIGALRHRVVLETETRTPDGGGGAALDWAPVAELWAAVRPLAGGESVAAEAVAGRLTHLVTIRYQPGVEPAMRFRLGPRILAIAAVLDVDERRRFLACHCREEGL